MPTERRAVPLDCYWSLTRACEQRCDHCRVSAGRRDPDELSVAAVEAVAREPAALILMDCQMPGVDGLEATRRLRAGGFSAPIVAVTANVSPGDRYRCLAAGMDDFLTKPINRKTLLQALHRWLPPQAAAAP